MAQKYIQGIPVQEVKTTKGDYSNDAVVNTEPKKLATNKPDIKDIQDIARNESATEWEKAIKEYVAQNGDTTEVGGDMEIDGDLTVNTKLDIGTSGSVGSNLKNAIIPDGTGHLNQVLIHETTGEMWGDYTPANIEYKNAAGTAYGQPLKFVKCSASEYSALTPDANTFYIIVG